MANPELIKALYKLLRYQQNKEKSKLRMRALRNTDPEAYTQKQQDYHYHRYHTDPEFKACTLQRFKDRQARQDALLLPDQTNKRKVEEGLLLLFWRII